MMHGSARRRTSAVAATLALVGLLAGCSAGTGTAGTPTPGAAGSTPTSTLPAPASTAPAPSPSASPEPLWVSYFYPAKVGYHCTIGEKLVSPVTGGGALTITAVSSNTVTSLAEVGSGRQYVVHSRTTTTSRQTGPYAFKVPTTVQDFTVGYVIAEDGTLQAPQQTVDASGFVVSFAGFVVYPSVEDLRTGASRESIVVAAGTSKVPAFAAQIRAATSDGSSTIRVSMTFKVTGVPGKTIVTPIGTFRDTVGLHLEVVSVSALNAKAGSPTAQQLTAAFQALGTANITLYWARGVGRVETVSKTAFGTDILKATSCH